MIRFYTPVRPLDRTEFVVLMALMTSFIALSIDIMLPALGIIGNDLGAVRDNDRQLIVGVLFFGMAIGQFLFGPVSDSSGRKPVILFGVSIFIVGCLVSAVADSLTMMLFGRFLQGLGAAAPRNVIIAMIRDCYAGRSMAQILSLIMSVFIIVPMVAPALGQGILWIADWRAIFYGMLGLAIIAQLWFSIRQPETLDPGSRHEFSAGHLTAALVEVIRTRSTMGYTLAMSLVFGAFVGYLASAQQVFQEIYLTGERFALYFSVLAGALGFASYLNSRMVMRFGMYRLTRISLIAVSIVSVLFLSYLVLFATHPPFWLLMAFLLACFFPFGILFGNLNALAMEPLGHIAGMGAAVVGSISTLLSVSIGSFIGQMFDVTILPLVIGFALNLNLALIVFLLTGRG